VGLGNQLLACYWRSQGMDVESPMDTGKAEADLAERFEKMSKRAHKWIMEE